MSRRNFTNATKDLAWGRASGRCEGCSTTIGPFHYDHIIACELGGEATLDNIQVLCKTCHGFKTNTADVPAIAKAKRRERRHAGIKGERTIRAWRKFNGEIVRAPRQR